MKNRITQIVTGGLVAVMGTLGMLAAPAYAADCVTNPDAPSCQVKQGVNASGGQGQTSLGDSIKLVINILLFIIGAVSVIMIIIGGIRYVLSNGESAQITGAKNAVLYAVIGLVVALLAYAIVNFVVAQFI